MLRCAVLCCVKRGFTAHGSMKRQPQRPPVCPLEALLSAHPAAPPLLPHPQSDEAGPTDLAGIMQNLQVRSVGRAVPRCAALLLHLATAACPGGRWAVGLLDVCSAALQAG